MDKIFSSFPVSGFLLILLGLSIRFFLIDFSFIKIGIAYVSGFLIGTLILGKNDIHDHIGFLPFSWVICITGMMVVLIWEKLRKPIHEGVFTMNIVIIIYWIIESSHGKHLSIYLLFLIALLFLMAIYQNVSSSKLPTWQRFIFVLINTIIMSVMGIIYINEILNLGISDLNNSATILNHGVYYFSFGLNVLFIAQQFLLISMLLPQKHRDYSLVFDEAFDEYTRNYSTEIQTNNLGYFIFIALLILTCLLNYIFTMINPMNLIGILFLLGSIFNALFIEEKTIIQG